MDVSIQPIPIPCRIMHVTNQTHHCSKHVLADLRPYVCLLPDCTSPIREFEGRRQWAGHIRNHHWRVWICVLDCGLSCESADDMRAHLAASHIDSPHADEIDALVEMSERPKPQDIACSCPLCHQQLNSLKNYASHVGRHQRDLSLFALPKLDGEDEDDIEELHTEPIPNEDQDSLTESDHSDAVSIGFIDL